MLVHLFWMVQNPTLQQTAQDSYQVEKSIKNKLIDILIQ